MTYVSLPSHISYSQDSISCYFDQSSKHSDKRIGETLDAICENRCTEHDIPMISVAFINSKFVTADNRRLWVFRQLELLGRMGHGVRVKIISNIPPEKLTAHGDGSTISVRGDPGGYWHYRSLPAPVITPTPSSQTTDPKTSRPQLMTLALRLLPASIRVVAQRMRTSKPTPALNTQKSTQNNKEMVVGDAQYYKADQSQHDMPLYTKFNSLSDIV